MLFALQETADAPVAATKGTQNGMSQGFSQGALTQAGMSMSQSLGMSQSGTLPSLSQAELSQVQSAMLQFILV